MRVVEPELVGSTPNPGVKVSTLLDAGSMGASPPHKSSQQCAHSAGPSSYGVSTPNLMMRYGLRMDRRQARTGLAVLGVVGTGIGVLYSLVGGPIGRIAGLP